MGATACRDCNRVVKPHATIIQIGDECGFSLSWPRHDVCLSSAFMRVLSGCGGFRRRPIIVATLQSGRIAEEIVMDLAMAMGCALFGMFAGSTFIFFYKLAK
jgi:hypothetical protein